MRTMPPMVSMALTDAASLVEAGFASAPPAAPAYPYGLRICLNSDQLEKLGLEVGDVSVGDTIHLNAFAKVVSIRQTEMDGGKSESSVELQITDIASEDEDTEFADEDDGPARHTSEQAARTFYRR